MRWKDGMGDAGMSWVGIGWVETRRRPCWRRQIGYENDGAVMHEADEGEVEADTVVIQASFHLPPSTLLQCL